MTELNVSLLPWQQKVFNDNTRFKVIAAGRRTGKSRLEILQDAGLDCTVVKKIPVADGIQAVRQMLPKCWFNKDKTQIGIDS